MDTTDTPRFVARPFGRNRWRVVDTVTGHIHSAEIADRARAESQARTMSRKHADMRARFVSRDGDGR